VSNVPETDRAGHEALAVVLQVRDGELQVLLWQRAREPFNGAWALPGGVLGASETLEASIRRHLATKVDVRELAHLEQLETRSDPARHPRRLIATAYLGLIPVRHDPAVPQDTSWHPVKTLPELAFDHGAIVLAGRERLRAKLSYTGCWSTPASHALRAGRAAARQRCSASGASAWRSPTSSPSSAPHADRQSL
jgi:ADP-ribose pyrophosphatase YjhB (NUDIX family)